MGKKQFCFFQTAETGNRTPDSGVKGSSANHYPRAIQHLLYCLHNYSHNGSLDVDFYDSISAGIFCVKVQRANNGCLAEFAFGAEFPNVKKAYNNKNYNNAIYISVNKKHLYNIYTTSDQRLRRWFNFV